MTDNIVEFPGQTKLDIRASKVLEGGTSADLEEVIVIGVRKNGSNYYAMSMADKARALWLIENFKQVLFQKEKT